MNFITNNTSAYEDAIVKGDNYRFSIITPRLIRMEYSENGVFEDRATQSVVNRRLDAVEYTVQQNAGKVVIENEYFRLTYRGGALEYGNIKIDCGKKGKFRSWMPGDWVSMKPGTARTLDTVNGETELENSVLSEENVGIFDDSNSLVIGENGTIEPRKGSEVDIYVFLYGNDYLECQRDFTRLMGGVPMIPRFALGNWWSRYHAYTQEEYLSLMDRFERERLPFSVAVLDMDWHLVKIAPEYGTGWTGYTWNDELFPDHVKFLETLHSRNMKVTLNLHPHDGVAAHEKQYESIAEVMGADPKSKQTIEFDITDSKFLDAYFNCLLHPLEEEGVDFWWMDWQQGTKSKLEGLDPLWALNHFHYIDNARDGKRPMIFSRYSGFGSQRYPIGFSGDTQITWESLDFQPYFTVSASNVGYGWWSHDIGGHMEGYYDPELMVRWVQFGVFSPIMRLHSSNEAFNGKEPWNYGMYESAIIGDFLRLRHKLIPYLYTMNYRAHKELIPLMTPMYYYTDKKVSNRNQYMFGDSMIAAPITSKSIEELQMGMAKVYLPAGKWYDFFTGASYEGDREYRVYRDLSKMPVFVKAGGIIPLSATDGNDVKNPEVLEIRIYPGAENRFVMYEDDGETQNYKNGEFAETEFVLKTNSFTICPVRGNSQSVPQKRRFKLVFVNIENCFDKAEIDGNTVETRVSYDNAQLTVEVEAETSQTVSVIFNKEIHEAKLDVKEEIKRLLMSMKCEYAVKSEIYSMANRCTKEQLICGVLSMDISENMKYAVLEPIFAI